MMDRQFWAALDRLVSASQIVIDRPKNSAHPRFPDMIYPLDYGYLANTASADGNGIDIWLGSLPERRAQAVICTVDLMKRDSEIKILISCTEAEQEIILKATPHKDHNKVLHTSCLHIFRHTARILFDIRQYACRKFVHSAEKSDCAICAQSLCGIALNFTTTANT